MREIRFTKAHGCGNDFLILRTPVADLADPAAFVRAICDRHFGVGADGVYFLSLEDGREADAAITLFNSDGSRAELSGNGTRCVAAVLFHERLQEGAITPGDADLMESAATRCLRIRTAAGVKDVELMEHDGPRFHFRMRVGPAEVGNGPDGTLSIWLGNPQCVAVVEDFDFDWAARGRTLGRHPFFPAGANIDFARVLDRHNVEARFWERGAGHTLASGTGSTAAAVAAIHLGRADSPVSIHTEGGVLIVEWQPGADAWLTGPAELVCEGVYWARPR